SAFDILPVLQTVVARAVELCTADSGSILRIEGGRGFFAANVGEMNDFEGWLRLSEGSSVEPSRGTTIGRVLLQNSTVQVADAVTDPDYTDHAGQKLTGGRTHLGVPILRDGLPVGVFVLRRRTVRPFSER